MVAVTLDIDWAPDFVIDFVADILVRHRVKSTWFVTHASRAVDRLRLHPELFELGVHPNFLPGSSQGSTPAEVLAFCRQCVPDARSMRTHSLVQSSPLLCQVLAQEWIERDVSLFLPYHSGLHPVFCRYAGRELIRIPYFWEDDVEMEQDPPDWNLPRLLDGDAPLAVFDFHPLLVYLNSASPDTYREMKPLVPDLARADQETVARFIHRGTGAGTAFAGLVAHLGRHGNRALKIAEIPVPNRSRSAKGAAA